MHEVWGMAALWLGLALLATRLTIWLSIATALSKIVVGTAPQLFTDSSIIALNYKDFVLRVKRISVDALPPLKHVGFPALVFLN